jgi:2-aminobenzoate-CoA ligase
VDTFARDRLPPKELWPRLHFDLPELRYPDRLNCATVLLDDAIAEGHGDRPAILTDAETITYRELQARANRIANALKEAGVVAGTGSCCAVITVELYAAWLAVVKMGRLRSPRCQCSARRSSGQSLQRRNRASRSQITGCSANSSLS